MMDPFNGTTIDLELDDMLDDMSDEDEVEVGEPEDLEIEIDYDIAKMERRAQRLARRAASRTPKPNLAAVYREMAADDVAETDVAFTYQAARHEQGWIMEALGPFFFQGLITDVLRLAKGGKEANVYICTADPELGVSHLAAKVYRPRRFRNLRNDALYRAGRRSLDASGHLIKDSRALHAMQKGTGFGKSLAHTSWLAHEHGVLTRLHAAGGDVPAPYGMGENAILMTYVGDDGLPAPTLNHVTLARDEAEPLFRRVMHNVELMLANQIVHGDLSAYNIMYRQGRITLIDFPQAVNPFDNPAGRTIFDRDIARVCDYFTAYGVEADAPALAEALWQKHGAGDLWTPVPLADGELDELMEEEGARRFTGSPSRR